VNQAGFSAGCPGHYFKNLVPGQSLV
jgi:hypothetical protein